MAAYGGCVLAVGVIAIREDGRRELACMVGGYMVIV